jgi:hypothetical protein
MLTLLSGASALGGALAAGRGHGGGGLTLLISVLLGSALAFLSVVVAHLSGQRASRHLLQSASAKGNWLLPLLYLAKFAWVVALAPLFSFTVVQGVIHAALR